MELSDVQQELVEVDGQEVVIPAITEWTRLTPEQLETWRERLSVLLSSERGEIIN